MSDQTITLDRLRAELASDTPPVLVEALGPQYYADAHLPGAVNVPHTQVEELAPTVLPDRDAPIVVYCANLACQNSAQAARRLRAMGYRNVRDYEAGKAEWVEAGLPTESSAIAV